MNAYTHPTIKWSEDKESVFIVFEVCDVEYPNITVESERVVFSATNRFGDLFCSLALKGSIHVPSEPAEWVSCAESVHLRILKLKPEPWGCLVPKGTFASCYIRHSFEHVWPQSADYENAYEDSYIPYEDMDEYEGGFEISDSSESS